MSLHKESMEILKSLSESVAKMPPQAQAVERAQANAVLEGMHKASLGHLSAEDLAAVAFVLATVTAGLAGLTVIDLAETLANSTHAYSLAAASLLGLYDLDAKPAGAGSDYVPGGYL